MTQSDRSEAFLKYRPLVRKIALSIGARCPSHVSREDLMSAGNLGLVQALRQWTPDADPDGFAAYASKRIRGAILDELRSADPLSRRDRRAVSRVNRAEQALRARLGHSVPPRDVAGQCGLDVAEYRRLKLAEMAVKPKELQEDTYCTQSEDIPTLCDARLLHNLVRQLSPRLRTVVEGYFQEDLSLREVGEQLGVSESRAHQLRTAALQQLRQLIEQEASRSVSLRRQVAIPSIVPTAMTRTYANPAAALTNTGFAA